MHIVQVDELGGFRVGRYKLGQQWLKGVSQALLSWNPSMMSMTEM